MSETRGFVTNLVGLYHEPETSFADLLPAARFWRPFAAYFVLTLAFTAVWVTQVDPRAFFEAQLEASGQAGRIPPDQRSAVLDSQARAFPYIAWLGPFVGVPFAVFLGAGVYSVVFRFFLGSEIPFKRTATIVAWTLLTVACVTTPLILCVLFLRGDWSLNPAQVLQANLAIAVEKDAVPRALYAILDSLDLFTLFGLYLLNAGFKMGAGLRPSLVRIGVVVPWALYVLLKAALALLGV
jgi:hypothetical protein